MQVKEHIVYGGSVSVALTPFFGAQTLLFFLSSVLIDLDHYVDFLYFSKFRNWSINGMFRFHGQLSAWKDDPKLYALQAFHTLEFFLAVLALAFYFRSTELFLLFSGLIFHYALDLLRIYQWERLYKKTIHPRAYSFLEYWIKARQMKRAGTDPEKIFQEAYAVTSQNHPSTSKNQQS